MINPNDFYQILKEKGLNFFAGVPDSLLQPICDYIYDHTDSKNNIITANEGNAIALSAGNYLATGNPGVVYMQNSGLGNAVNPLLSLADETVYQVPLLLLIGWRGQPGRPDAVQHLKQGQVTLDILEAMQIPYSILPSSLEEVESVLAEVHRYFQSNYTPYALVVEKGTFQNYTSRSKLSDCVYSLTREQAIECIVESLQPDDIVISSTGKISRELYEIREGYDQGHHRDFLMVGSMGHCSQIALGIALNKQSRNVLCLEGDGSFLMHMGGQALVGANSFANFKHVVLNNGSHNSVGGLPTAGFQIDFKDIVLGCGYKEYLLADNLQELRHRVNELHRLKGPLLLEIKINRGARTDLGRPDIDALQRKQLFMEFLEESDA